MLAMKNAQAMSQSIDKTLKSVNFITYSARGCMAIGLCQDLTGMVEV
jgi:hypothetical protein